MEEVVLSTKIALANTFIMYFRAHSYHWNVESKNFSEMHAFFGGIYEEVHDAIDAIAEELRALDVYAPISLTEMYNYKTASEDTDKPVNVQAMLTNLAASNGLVIDALNKVFSTATAANQQGLADFAVGRIDVHKKHGWMIRSYLKSAD